MHWHAPEGIPHLLAAAQGMRVNYGHFDLLLGRNAPEEVYSLVEGWLVKMEEGIAKASPS